MRDDEPAIWALAQDYTAPGRPRADPPAGSSRACAWRTTARAGSARTSARTRARRRTGCASRARRSANLSPIFSLYGDPAGAAWGALEPHIGGEPWGEATDEDGTLHRLWRVADAGAIDAVHDALADAELLIADGHHRYETARVYADEIGGEGDHRYVLMCLVALEDEGLTVFPTHRLVQGTTPATQEALADALREHFEIEPIDARGAARRPTSDGPLVHGLPRRALQAAVPPDAQGPGDRRRACSTACPSPTAVSTPRCSRR